MISCKELVQRALAFEPVPRIPYCIGFCANSRERLCASTEGRKLFESIHNDMIFSVVLGIEGQVHDASGKYVDEFGVVWDRTVDIDIGCPSPHLTPERFWEYRWPDPLAQGRFDTLAENMKRYPETFHVMTFGFSLFERAWALRGMENLLVDFVDRRDFVDALLDGITDLNLTVLEAGLKACPDIDGVYFGDDFGTQMGLIMGAARWREIFKPRLARMYGAVKSAGKKVIIHCCGRVQEIFDDFVEIGLDCFNPFQPEVMDVYDMFRQYHGKLAFWGGISTQHLLPFGTVDEVDAEVNRLLDMGANGGYVIAPAHAIPGDAKVENMAAMLRKILWQHGSPAV